MKCKFSVCYLVYNNYKLISEAAIGMGSRKLRILRLLHCCRYLKNRKNLHFAGIPVQQYLQKGSVFIKLQASNLKNEFLNRYFSRMFLKIK